MHHITGLIGRQDVLKALGDPFSQQPCYALKHDLAFMPLDGENLDSIDADNREPAIGKFSYLTTTLVESLRRASQGRVIAYIETDYWGGSGDQGAAVFSNGEIVYEPTHNENAINTALAALGVSRDLSAIDAFQSVGLPSFRDNARFRKAGKLV